MNSPLPGKGSTIVGVGSNVGVGKIIGQAFGAQSLLELPARSVTLTSTVGASGPTWKYPEDQGLEQSTHALSLERPHSTVEIPERPSL
jgi:hypothetical protein